jgi:hypothetical protein
MVGARISVPISPSSASSPDAQAPGMAERLTEARMEWWKSRNRLGVKLLDFGEP